MLFVLKSHPFYFQRFLAFLLRLHVDQKKFIISFLRQNALVNLSSNQLWQRVLRKLFTILILTSWDCVWGPRCWCTTHLNMQLIKKATQLIIEKLNMIYQRNRPIARLFFNLFQGTKKQDHSIIFITSMPPKKQEKKEIVKAFEPQKFWVYHAYGQDAVDKATNFLTTFEKQLSELISQQKSLEQNFETLCSKMGIAVHPCLQNIVKEQSKFPELKNKQYGARSLQILNYKIDALTLKVLHYLLSYYKINSIKLSRNQLQAESEILKKMLEKENSISILFLEWNPLTNIPNRKEIFVSAVRPSLQHLILRQNNLGNQICTQIINKVKQSPEMTLKSLDLTGNQLTTEIAGVLCKFVEEQKNIQFLGLSKNKLNSNQFLNRLFSSIGEVPLTEQDYAKYLQSVKARDQAVERNKKKKKGAPDEPIPFVFELKQNQKGRFYIKNNSIQNINLAKNGISDSSLGLIKQFAENQGSKIQVFLDSNKLGKKTKEILQIYKNILL